MCDKYEMIVYTVLPFYGIDSFDLTKLYSFEVTE